MLDYKNENWWVYNVVITVCSVGVIIVAIIYNINKESLDSSSICILMNIQQIMLIISFGLLGSREVFTKKEKIGCFYYLIVLFTFIVLIARNFLH